MGNKHKNPTISFRITDAEQKQIEARILASGMMKKDYFVRFGICVVYHRKRSVSFPASIPPQLKSMSMASAIQSPTN